MIDILSPLIAICIFITFNNISNKDISNSLFGIIALTLSVISLVTYIENPKAIDVYRNKTELKISGIYKDSIFIPTDSIVIFKK